MIHRHAAAALGRIARRSRCARLERGLATKATRTTPSSRTCSRSCTAVPAPCSSTRPAAATGACSTTMMTSSLRRTPTVSRSGVRARATGWNRRQRRHDQFPISGGCLAASLAAPAALATPPKPPHRPPPPTRARPRGSGPSRTRDPRDVGQLDRPMNLVASSCSRVSPDRAAPSDRTSDGLREGVAAAEHHHDHISERKKRHEDACCSPSATCGRSSRIVRDPRASSGRRHPP